MQKRPLGDSGLQTAPLVFGGNVFGWTADRDRSFALLDAFVDAGFNVVGMKLLDNVEPAASE